MRIHPPAHPRVESANQAERVTCHLTPQAAGWRVADVGLASRPAADAIGPALWHAAAAAAAAARPAAQRPVVSGCGVLNEQHSLVVQLRHLGTEAGRRRGWAVLDGNPSTCCIPGMPGQGGTILTLNTWQRQHPPQP